MEGHFMDKEIDLLNRQKFVEDVITLVRQLSENQKGCCFAIEGSWGIGKTFMLEMMERELESTYKDSFFNFITIAGNMIIMKNRQLLLFLQ